MSNVIPFHSAEERQERRQKRARKQGASAWERLQRTRRLSRSDRTALAQNLHKIILREKLSRVELAEQAGFEEGPKEIYRLTLPPGTVARKDRLRASPPKYVRLIDAIQRITKHNLPTLVDLLTIGTTVHPRFNEQLDAAGRLETTLQQYANKLDGQFDLLSKFRRIAELKVEHIGAGGTENWPFYPIDEDPNEDEATRHFLVAEHAYADPLNTSVSDHLQVNLHEGLQALPRFYIGRIIDWQDYSNTSDGPDAGTKRRVRRELRERAASLFAKYCGDPAHPINDQTDWDCTWLVLYPTADLTSVVPTLWICWEGFVQSSHLDAQQLLIARDLEWFAIDGTATATLYERIEASVADGTLLQDWTRTARDLDHVPFLVEDHSKAQREAAVKRIFENLWAGE